MPHTWNSEFNEYAVEYDLRGEGYVAFVVNSQVGGSIFEGVLHTTM